MSDPHEPPPPGAEDLWFKLDRIARRQQGKFFDRQRAAGRLTPELEADLGRLFVFIFGDVKGAIREHIQEHAHEHR